MLFTFSRKTLFQVFSCQVLLKRCIILGLALNSLLPQPVAARTLSSIATDNPEVQIQAQLTDQAANASHAFLQADTVDLNFTLIPSKTQIGKAAHLFAVADYNGQFYQHTENTWVAWDGNADHLLPFKRQTLAEKQSINLIQQTGLPAGEFLLYTGFQIEGESILFYNQTPAAFVVFDQQQAALHQIQHPEVLQQMLATDKTSTMMFYDDGLVPTTAPPIMTNDDAAESSVSRTNLQELGIDEADRIKVQGDRLYVLESCTDNISNECLGLYQIQAAPEATNQRLLQKPLADNARDGQLYLTQDADHLVYLQGTQNDPIYQIWDIPYYWQDQTTNIQIMNVASDQRVDDVHNVMIDGSLLSSRMVDDVLYLVTRKNAYFAMPFDIMPSADENIIKTEDTNSNIADLLPTIAIDQAETKPLVSANDCYVPRSSSSQPLNNTLTALVAINITNPEQHHATCVVGHIDTFYMSTAALYLATSRYPYQVEGNAIVYDSSQQEVQTDIHKFAFNSGLLNYKASGSVMGHLGWEVDKQPFRMGENNGILKVATSVGDTGSDNARSRVSVLQEQGNNLVEVGSLENLGKPGERLYAARFIGDRGYLVTFKVTDPLYVLDFSTPSQPQILGELEIDGYSDYLHPIGEDYVLGIGKDAIPDTLGDSRGAWYQGLKLALYDVRQPAQPREVSTMVIGKRGTESVALTDHHGLTWLDKGNDSAYLALPVELHDTPYSEAVGYGEDYYQQPNAYYDWTHTGLYTFSINTGVNPSIQLTQPLITHEANGTTPDYNAISTYNDRAVIQDNAVHYIHNNRVFSSAIQP